MSLVQWLRPPRYLLAIFLGVMVLPAAALAWLGWRFIEQDRALEIQRSREYLEQTADLVAGSLERRLNAWAAQLQPDFADLRPGPAVAVRLTAAGVIAHSGAPLLYQPRVNPPQESAVEIFAAGEALEFRARDPAR